MPTAANKLANSLDVLRQLQVAGQHVFRSRDLSRTHRERLVRGGFLRPVLRGWLISSSPDTRAGDSTPWYANFWEFCARYCESRFGSRWHLSPEQSLLLHGQNTTIPPQVIIYATRGTNNNLTLPFGTSLYDYREATPPPAEDTVANDGLRVYTPEAALARVPEAFFVSQPLEAQLALDRLRDASGLLRVLLRGGHSVVAGRLMGALRRIGRPELADEIGATMRAADHVVVERDPFDATQTMVAVRRDVAPIVARLHGMWQTLREDVLASFPPAPGLAADAGKYLNDVEERYQSDAYHSLSIEGYQVSADLIERVRSGTWQPNDNESDRQSRNALAARGYWQAFQRVKASIGQVLGGASAGAVARSAHGSWYRELFQPAVAAGLATPESLAGYRQHFVFLRTSRYVPPRWETVRDAMPALFDLLESEPEASVRAVLGHWLIGYIHPYMDGNGRMARFLMNVMLASGGFPWTIVRVDDRSRYLAALDQASLNNDIVPFATFIAECTLARNQPEPH